MGGGRYRPHVTSHESPVPRIGAALGASRSTARRSRRGSVGMRALVQLPSRSIRAHDQSRGLRQRPRPRRSALARDESKCGRAGATRPERKVVMQTNQQLLHDAASSANGQSTPHDLFALTDEQILEIEPEVQEVQRSSADVQPESKRDTSAARLPRNGDPQAGSPDAGATSHEPPATSHVPQEPPEWLAQRMKDPWKGAQTRELWNGVQQAKQEAAAYRTAVSTPEDARALKELYPGGVGEARAAAERARVLDAIDRSYFGGAGKSAQGVSALPAELAQRMLRDDPAAFREMVFAGLRALEESGAQTANNATQAQGGLKSAPTNAPAQ